MKKKTKMKMRTAKDVWENPLAGDEIFKPGIIPFRFRFGGIDHQTLSSKKPYSIYNICDDGSHRHIQQHEWKKLKKEGWKVCSIEQRDEQGHILLAVKVKV